MSVLGESPFARHCVRVVRACVCVCFSVLARSVYDFTDFVEEHPGGAKSIEDIGGTDGTVAFQAIHSQAMLEDFTPIGRFSL